MPETVTPLSSTECNRVTAFKAYCGAINSNKGREANLLHALLNYTFLSELNDERVKEYNGVIEALKALPDLNTSEAYCEEAHKRMRLGRIFAYSSADMILMDKFSYMPTPPEKGNVPILRLPGDVDLLAIGQKDVAPLATFCDGFAERYGKVRMERFGAGVPDELYQGRIRSHTDLAAKHVHSMGICLDITPPMFAQLLKKGGRYLGQPELKRQLVNWVAGDNRFKQEVVDAINAAYMERMHSNGIKGDYLIPPCTRDKLRAVLWVDCKMDAPEPIFTPEAYHANTNMTHSRTGALLPLLVNHENFFADVARKFLQASMTGGPPEAVATSIMDFGLRCTALYNALLPYYPNKETFDSDFGRFIFSVAHLLAPTEPGFYMKPADEIFPPQDYDKLKELGPRIEEICGHKYYIKPEEAAQGQTLEKAYYGALKYYQGMATTVQGHVPMRDSLKDYFTQARAGKLDREHIDNHVTHVFLFHTPLNPMFSFPPEHALTEHVMQDCNQFAYDRLQNAVIAARENAEEIRNARGRKK